MTSQNPLLSRLKHSLAIGLIGLTFTSANVLADNDASAKANMNSMASSMANGKATEPDYLTISQDNLVYMQTSKGMMALEITNIQSPLAAEQFKNLVKEGFYNGLDFYRVVDGFVIQGGEQEYKAETSKKSQFRNTLKAEFTRPVLVNSRFMSIQSPALLAPEEGLIDTFPAGRDSETNEEWLLHCPGTLAMARDVDPDTASTEFYATIGHAPRHLDRNMSVIGRVIDGMEVAQAMHRGPMETSGVIADNKPKTKILSATLGPDQNPALLRQYKIENPRGERYQNRLNNARNNPGPFLVYPGRGNVDICYHKPRISRS